MRLQTLPTLLVIIAISSLMQSSCNRASNSSNPTASNKQAIQIGKSVFSFDFEKTTELMIAKNDPQSGDRWGTVVRRNPDNGNWMISSAPEGRQLIDRQADSSFINHLLDTLRTLQATAEAPEGPLSAFGLSIPLFALKWTNPSESYEVRFGDSHLQAGATYAHVPHSNLDVFLSKGAALQMLAQLDRFERLRKPQLLDFTSDDIDEIQVILPKSAALHSVRNGDRWADTKEVNLSDKKNEALSRLLEDLTHLRILRFIDDPELTQELMKQIKTRPSIHTRFKGRTLTQADLQVAKIGKNTYATISSRPGAVFEIYPKIAELFR